MTAEPESTRTPVLDPRPEAPSGYLPGRWFSFKAALSGAVFTLRTQPNALIELFAILVVALAGWWLEISRIEWIILGFTIAVIFAVEAVNTAVWLT